MRNIIFSFIAVGGAAFCDFFVVDLSAAMTIALALTGLLAAATEGDVKEIHRLLKSGENPNQADENGWTALMSAADNGHSESVKDFTRQRRKAKSSKQKRSDGFDMGDFWRTFRSRQSFARQRRSTESGRRKWLDGFDGRGR